MGIHTGEPAIREDDLHGRTVVKAARIADLARGGEILVSSVVRELAQADEDLDQELWFDDTREVELRGLRGRHLVMAAKWAELTPSALRVVIADDSALVRDGVAAVLRECGVHVAALAGDAEALYREVERHRPDVALVDIRMPPTHTDEGLVAAQTIRAEHPQVGVLVLSQYVEPSYALRLIQEHPERVGYLLKERVFDIATVVDALRRIVDGETVIDPTIVSRLVGRRRRQDPLAVLSEREREVLGLIAEGMSNRAIAARLYVTERTVEAHVTQIFQKLRLPESPDQHRRVLAVLTFLRA
jgi:DNA-binding NarL/FixJ family response regulator